MPKVTISTIQGAYASTSELNANFQALADEFENAVSRDGTTPNAMDAAFDMGGNDIINAGNVFATNLVYSGAETLAASNVNIADAGGLFTADNAEDAHAETATALNVAEAAIVSNLATALARANHTGSQAASTISDFEAAVSANSSVAANTAKKTSELVQQVYATYNGVNTGTTLLPVDDTIPQNTEGTEFMTLAITPEDAANILLIEVFGFFACSVQVFIGKALFQDSTAAALAATSGTSQAGFTQPIALQHLMVAGTASATTFKFRMGPTSAGTVTLNGQSSSRRFGGVAVSGMRITEYLP